MRHHGSPGRSARAPRPVSPCRAPPAAAARVQRVSVRAPLRRVLGQTPARTPQGAAREQLPALGRQWHALPLQHVPGPAAARARHEQRERATAHGLQVTARTDGLCSDPVQDRALFIFVETKQRLSFWEEACATNVVLCGY